MNKQSLKSLTIAGAVAAVFSSPMVMADSAILINKANGHKYQRIDKSLTWTMASDYCKNIVSSAGGYLATITTQVENDFIINNFATDSYQTYWLGGSDIQQQGVWKWVTTENFSYANWDTDRNEPVIGNGQYITLSQPGAWYSYQWHVHKGTDPSNGFICEWGDKAYIDVLGLSDLNSNGSSESAALYLDTTFAHNVVIKDTSTQETLKTIVFDTKNATPPIAIAQVSDMNANGAPEIAVMYWTKKSGAIGPMIGIMIKDASTGLASRTAPIKILSNQYKAISLTSTPDMTGDGISELQVLVMKYKDSSVSSQIIDPVAGTVIKSVSF